MGAHEGRDGRRLTVWLDEAEILPGQSIPGAIDAGLEASRFFALLMSTAYFESRSGWTDAERHAILHTDPDNRRGRILPVLIANCPKIPPLLRHLRIIDMREPRYEEGLREILSILRDEPQPSATIYKGQLILAGRRLARDTLVAERALVDAEPAAATEFFSCYLLPVERPPSLVYTAPIAMSLRAPRLDGTHTVPSKSLVKQAIHEAQEKAGRRPFTPAFRIVGEEIVTFHDLEAEDGVFAQVIDRGRAGRERAEEWLADPDDRKVITSLLNMAVSRHAHHRGLKEDNERRHRFFFPHKEGLSWSITWKPLHNTVSREVGRPAERSEG